MNQIKSIKVNSRIEKNSIFRQLKLLFLISNYGENFNSYTIYQTP